MGPPESSNQTVMTERPAPLCIDSLSVGALSGIAITVQPGEIVALSGASGSGKSRLLRAIADLDPHTGAVTLGDTPRESMAGHAWRRTVMMVPAESQWWADTVGAHFPAVDHADLAALGFTPAVLDWSVSRLSSGEKQRLALLRAVAHGPRALLLDEPTANLDTDTALKVEAWLCTHIRRARWPVIWVAHDARQIERVADRHLRIAGARLEAAA